MCCLLVVVLSCALCVVCGFLLVVCCVGFVCHVSLIVRCSLRVVRWRLCVVSCVLCDGLCCLLVVACCVIIPFGGDVVLCGCVRGAWSLFLRCRSLVVCWWLCVVVLLLVRCSLMLLV